MGLGLGLGHTFDNSSSIDLFNLKQVENLKAWYKFRTGLTLSGSNVTDWADSSGNTTEDMDLGKVGVVTYDSGTGALGFTDANNSVLETASDQLNLGEFTIFGVVDVDEGGAANEAVIGRAGNDEFRLFRGGNNKNVRLRANGVNYDITMTNALPTGKFLFTITRASDGAFTIRIDGGLQGSVATDIANLFDFTKIGNGATDSRVFEIAIYNKKLSEANVEAIERNINYRVGL